MTKEKQKLVCVRLPSDLYQSIKVYAAEQEITVQKLLAEIIAPHFKK